MPIENIEYFINSSPSQTAHTHTPPLTFSNFHLKSQMITRTTIIWTCLTQRLFCNQYYSHCANWSKRNLAYAITALVSWHMQKKLWPYTDMDPQIHGHFFLRSFKLGHQKFCSWNADLDVYRDQPEGPIIQLILSTGLKTHSHWHLFPTWRSSLVHKILDQVVLPRRQTSAIG